MRFRFATAQFLAFAVLLGFLVRVRAEPPVAPKAIAEKKTTFLRIQRDDKKQPVALETAIVHYVPASGEKGVELDLVAAVHVGDKEYYGKLNKAFEKYDVVLFELVAPQGAQIPRGGPKSDSPLAMIQQLAKVVLELDLQLEQIDYTKKNFVHADLSPQDMLKAAKERGEDGLTLTLSIAADLLRKQNLQNMKPAGQAGQAGDVDIAGLLLDPERGVKLKRLMAEQFEQLDSADAGFGKTVNQILVKDRNKAALKVFQQQLAKGKKKVAIFYGAAHMPDFEKRLKEEFGLKRQGEEWLQAWDLRPGAKKMGIEDLLKKLLDD